MWIVWVIVALLALCILATVGIFLFTFFYPKKWHTDDFHYPDSPLAEPYKDEAFELIKKFQSLPCERVETTSFDGLKLSARYYKQSEVAPIAICFHGYKSTAIKDMCGGSLHLIDKGFNILLCDQRAHGESEGRVISFGINERHDVQTWCEFARRKYGPVPFYLVVMTVLYYHPELIDSLQRVVKGAKDLTGQEYVTHIQYIDEDDNFDDAPPGSIAVFLKRGTLDPNEPQYGTIVLTPGKSRMVM